jgi:dihydroorotate dehydrogenase (fumarate)
MSDLTTTYLGMKLKSPLVVSASPLTEKLDNIRRMEDAGASAIVMHSLFEEQINRESETLDDYLWQGTESFAESLTYFPDMTKYNLGPEGYLEHLRKAKAAVNIPVIASLNGVSTGGWIEYAQKMEQAGADALELNIFFIPTDSEMSGEEVERIYVELATNVRSSVKIPVAVKFGLYFSSIPNLARKMDQAGVAGLVMFNRFYQPDFDLDNLEVVPHLILSTPYDLLIRLHWVAILSGHVKADMAVTGGVHSALDVLKAMMAGARVTMMTSALLRNGIEHLTLVRADLESWMEEHEYESIRQMQGSMSQRSVAEPAAFVRANYMKMLSAHSQRSSHV